MEGERESQREPKRERARVRESGGANVPTLPFEGMAPPLEETAST